MVCWIVAASYYIISPYCCIPSCLYFYRNWYKIIWNVFYKNFTNILKDSYVRSCHFSRAAGFSRAKASQVGLLVVGWWQSSTGSLGGCYVLSTKTNSSNKWTRQKLNSQKLNSQKLIWQKLQLIKMDVGYFFEKPLSRHMRRFYQKRVFEAWGIRTLHFYRTLQK